MNEKELTAWWAGLSDDQRGQLKASAETGTLEGGTRELLMAMTTTVTMSGVTTYGDGIGEQVQGWNPIVRAFVLAQ